MFEFLHCRTAYLKEKLETALSEIELMKEDRERQRELVCIFFTRDLSSCTYIL